MDLLMTLPSLLLRYHLLPAWDQGYLAHDLQRRDFASLARGVAAAEQKVDASTVKEYQDDSISIVRKPLPRARFHYEVTASRGKLEELDVLGPLAFPPGRKRTACVWEKQTDGDNEFGRFWSLKAVKGGFWRLSFDGAERSAKLDQILNGLKNEPVSRGHLRLVWSA